MRIDLHTHSTASDGTLSPAELMHAAQAAGLDVVALTDHDTTAGWPSAVAALPSGLALIRGAELSCMWEPRLSTSETTADLKPLSMHLLAYLFDREELVFAAERRKIRESRSVRGRQIVEQLRGDGIDVTWEEIEDYAQGAPVGRPHIGRALLERQLVEDMKGAFAPEWLGEKYRVIKAETDIFTAIRLVREAGGVTALAHPRAEKRGRTLADSLIAELTAAGLTGIEVDHLDHSEEQRAYLRGFAKEVGLVPLGSSDFHGTHKAIGLGEFTTSVEAYEELLSSATGCEPVIG